MIDADVGALEQRRELELVGSDLVVARLHGHAELEQFALDVGHEGEHARVDRAEVVVVELLALWRLRAEERAACDHQVGAFEEVLLVDQEVLLLGPDVGEHVLDVLVAEEVRTP